MKGYLFMMVLLIVLAIPLFGTPVQDNTGANYLRISIIEQEEVVGSDLYMTVTYEILAIKPAGIKQSWLPLDTNNGRLYAKADVNTKLGNHNIQNNRGGRRIKSGRH